ncbi:kininogen-1 [Grus japonensis]|uniref:Kininogen-1 n=1 Tax=Grus japonensis TaxID=30415 RepID=A0ABC9X7Z0_GRUJA
MKLFIVLALCCSFFSSTATPLPFEFLDCDDPDVFKAVNTALKKYNGDRATGNQFALYMVMEAKRTAGLDTQFYVKYRMHETICAIEENKLWQDCDYKVSAEAVVAGQNYHLVFAIQKTNCSKKEFEKFSEDCEATPNSAVLLRRPPGFTPFRSFAMIEQPNEISCSDKNEEERQRPDKETREDGGQEPEAVGITVAPRLHTQQLGMCHSSVYCASIAITSLVRKNEIDEDYLENVKQRDQRGQEVLAQKVQKDLEREKSYKKRSEDTEVERTEAGWNDMDGVKRTKEKTSDLVAKMETE